MGHIEPVLEKQALDWKIIVLKILLLWQCEIMICLGGGAYFILQHV